MNQLVLERELLQETDCNKGIEIVFGPSRQARVRPESDGDSEAKLAATVERVKNPPRRTRKAL